MLVNESIWLGKTILTFSTTEKVSPILNLGSSTGTFRENEQPHINKNIFALLKKENINVTHLDLKDAEGVDIVGDITDNTFFDKLKTSNFNSIICSNLLEHINNPLNITKKMTDLLPTGGLLFITVPHIFPYHNDPIDTYFRPSFDELAAMFPNTEMIFSEYVIEDDKHINLFIKNPKLFFITLARLVMPFYKFESWKFHVKDLKNWNRKFEATCLVLKKK